MVKRTRKGEKEDGGEKKVWLEIKKIEKNNNVTFLTNLQIMCKSLPY